VSGTALRGFVAVVADAVGAIDGDQQRVEVQIVQMRRAAADLRQQVGPPDHLVERPRADRWRGSRAPPARRR
jgi:hypothetical protein